MKIKIYVLSMKTYILKSTYVTGSKPGIMYGLPKLHKDNCPLRPILSAIGTFDCNVSKFLIQIIAITTNDFIKIRFL